MAVITASAAGGKWSQTTAWEGGKVPGEEDDVILGAGSGSIEIAAEAKCRSLEASLYAKTLTIAAETALKIGAPTNNAGLCMHLSAGMTLTCGALAVIRYTTTSATTQQITTGGQALPETEVLTTTGTYRFMDKYSSTGELRVEKGTLETNGQEVVVGQFIVPGGVEAKVKLGASIIKVTGTSGVVWEVKATASFEAGTSSVQVTGAGEEAKKFLGGNQTYNNVSIPSDNTLIEGSNTFLNLAINTSGKSVKGTSVKEGVTLTVTGSLTTNATTAAKIKLKSSVAGKAWKLEVATGVVEVTGIELQDSTAEGGAEFRDVGGVNVSGNTGWKFGVWVALAAASGSATTSLALRGPSKVSGASAASATTKLNITAAPKVPLATAVGSTTTKLGLTASPELTLGAAEANAATNIEENEIPNPSFEYDEVGAAPAGWLNSGMSLFKVTNIWAASGGQSAQFATPTLGALGLSGVFAIGPVAIPGVRAGWVTTPGTTYGVQAILNTTSVTGEMVAGIEIWWYDATGKYLSASAPRVNVVLGEQGSSAVVTAPALAAYLSFSLTFLSIKEGGKMAGYFDAVMQQEGATVVTPYGDGDSAGAYWDGVRGNSVSTRSGTLELTAKALVPLASSKGTATTALGLTAPTRIGLSATGASTSGVTVVTSAPILGEATGEATTILALTVPTTVPLAAAAATCECSLSVTAEAAISLSTSGVATTQIALSAQVSISSLNSAATSTDALAVTASTMVPLATSGGLSTTTATLTTPVALGLMAAAAGSAATASVTVATLLVPGATSGESSTALTLVASTTVPLASSGASSTSALGLNAPTTVTFGASAGSSTTAALVKVVVGAIALAASTGVSTTTAAVTTTAPLALAAAGQSTATVSLNITATVGLQAATASATTAAAVTAANPLALASTGTSTTSAAFSITAALSLGNAIGQSTAMGALSAAPRFSLPSSGLSGAQAVFGVSGSISGSSTASASSSLLLTAPVWVALSAGVGQSTATLSMTTSIQLGSMSSMATSGDSLTLRIELFTPGWLSSSSEPADSLTSDVSSSGIVSSSTQSDSLASTTQPLTLTSQEPALLIESSAD
jgi:hypothetical protein